MTHHTNAVLADKKPQAEASLDPVEEFERELRVPEFRGDPVKDLSVVCDTWIRCSWRAVNLACAAGITRSARPRSAFFAAVRERFEPVLEGASRRILASTPPSDRSDVRRQLLQVQEALRLFHRILDTDPLTLHRKGVSASAFPAWVEDQLTELRWTVAAPEHALDHAAPKSRHLTERESQVWKALACNQYIAKEIARVIKSDPSLVRRAIASMRRKGYQIEGGKGGRGYWRPDAPARVSATPAPQRVR